MLTVIAAETRITGVVEGGGDLRVAGWLEGRVLLPEGTVTVERDATLRGNCVARHVIVAGNLVGDVSAESVHVHEGGRVVGELAADDVAIDEGGALRGRIRSLAAASACEQAARVPAPEPAPRLGEASEPPGLLRLASVSQAGPPAAPRPRGRHKATMVSR
ncbi:MAG: polymer-forming cytoskeletal protein [Deltaproteobacteria bacterium]|nr:polymer-forming cytoskeletal protein [Deltaproteobacteria bacterium]